MATFDLLRDLPLVSATAWFALAALQVYRDRIHTWTETFFLAACFFAGFYAVADWLFFNAMNDTSAFLAALMSLTSVALTVLFLFLFTLVYIGRMKRAYWSFTAVATGMLLLLWTNGLEGVVRPPAGGGLYYPVFNPAGFLVFLVYIIAFSLGGVVNLYRLHRIVRESSAQLARRIDSGLRLDARLLDERLIDEEHPEEFVRSAGLRRDPLPVCEDLAVESFKFEEQVSHLPPQLIRLFALEDDGEICVPTALHDESVRSVTNGSQRLASEDGERRPHEVLDDVQRGAK